jgi:hypothetical protein
MASAAVEMFGKKKRRREKKEGASTSSAALGVHASKHRKRMAQRGSQQASGTYTYLSLI